MEKFTVLNEFIRVTSKWVTIIGEKCKEKEDVPFEYWRVEKDHSLIILPMQNNYILLPPPVYRHGVGVMTLDLPGGRVASTNAEGLVNAACTILNRELCVCPADVDHIQPLFKSPLLINSSFSNQKLFAFTAVINSSWEASPETEISRYSLSVQGLTALLESMECLQCRSVLLEFFYQKTNSSNQLKEE